MDFGKEFEKYAVKHRGISGNMLDDYNKKNTQKYIAQSSPFGGGGGCWDL